jgi:hypothetical protein
MRDTSERLRDIQEAISRIERYAVRGRAAFDQDELIQNWIVHHLQRPVRGRLSSTCDPTFSVSQAVEQCDTLSPNRAIGTPVVRAHAAQIRRAARP